MRGTPAGRYCFTCRAEVQTRKVRAASSLKTEIVGDVDGLEPRRDGEAVALALALTGENAARTVPFGTEAGLFQALGISAVACGPGEIAQAHKPDEFVEISELRACLDFLRRLSARRKR
ncbi:MAG: M20/M25/M40 family metallo-hydrolase [Paracoccaceae bacterium]